MKIEKTLEDSSLNLKVSGRLDTITAPELDDSIRESIEDAENVTLDFSDLEYISSAGLRVLLATQKNISDRGELTVTGVNDMVMDVFEVTGFTDILIIKR